MGGDVAPERIQHLDPVPAPLGRLDRTLLVHCRTREVAAAAQVADRAGTGLVITADRRDLIGAYQAARHLLEVGSYRQPILLDANRYAGSRRLPATAPFNPQWLRRQRELGVPVLTDSGYVAEGDAIGLTQILHRTAELGAAIALLPLHLSWLTAPNLRRALCRRVRYYAVPVAIVVEHPADPFGALSAVDGLLELLNCGPPVLLLRSDVSALGALCCGAIAAAVGTEASLRHLYPQRPFRPRPGPSLSRPAVVVPQCLSYKRLNVVAEAKRRHPDSGMWHCDCGLCAGRDLDWMLARPEPEHPRLAFQHSLNLLIDLRTDLVGPIGRRDQLSWRARCAAAASRRREVGWARLPMLDRWQEAITAPIPDDPSPRLSWASHPAASTTGAGFFG